MKCSECNYPIKKLDGKDLVYIKPLDAETRRYRWDVKCVCGKVNKVIDDRKIADERPYDHKWQVSCLVCNKINDSNKDCLCAF